MVKHRTLLLCLVFMFGAKPIFASDLKNSCVLDNVTPLSGEVTQQQNDDMVYYTVSDGDVAKITALLRAGYSADFMVASRFETSGEISFIMSRTNTGSPDEKVNQAGIVALIEGGADISVTDEDDNTLLHIAARRNKLNVVQALLRCGLNQKLLNKNGESPLFNAVTLAMYQLLIKHNVGSVDDVDRWNNTSLHEYAANHIATDDLIEYMTKHINVNQLNSDHLTPIQWTIKRNRLFSEDNSRLLIAHGADLEIADSDGRTVLMNALRREDLDDDFITELISASKNLGTKDRFNKSAIHYVGGNINVMDSLKQAGVSLANTRYPNDERSTLLTTAVSKKQMPLIRYLLREKVAINAQDFSGRTALNYAIEQQSHEMVKLLKMNGAIASSDQVIASKLAAYEHEKARPKNIVEAVSQKNMALVKHYLTIAKKDADFDINKAGIKAVDVGFVAGLDYLVNHGFSLKTRDQGYSLLQNSVFFNQPEMVDYLLSKGAKVDYKTDENATVMYMTANADIKMIKKLEALGLKFDPVLDQDIVSEAIRVDKYQMAHEFLRRGFAFDTDKHFAPEYLESKVIRQQNSKRLAFLVEQGFDINTKFTKLLKDGNLLYLSIMLRATKMIEPLLTLGIDTSVLIEGESILSIAIMKRDLDSIKLILKHRPNIELNTMGTGAFLVKKNVLLKALHRKAPELSLYFTTLSLDFSQQTSDNQTALSLAVVHDYAEVVKALIDKGVDVNHQDKWGNTPLFLAASKGSVESIKLLMAAGADATIKNDNGQIPAQLLSDTD